MSHPVITKLQYAGAVGWMQITNPDATTDDISGWTVYSMTMKGRLVFPTGTKLYPGGNIIIASNSDAYYQAYQAYCNFVIPGLLEGENSQDGWMLVNQYLQVVDGVQWIRMFGFTVQAGQNETLTRVATSTTGLVNPNDAWIASPIVPSTSQPSADVNTPAPGTIAVTPTDAPADGPSNGPQQQIIYMYPDLNLDTKLLAVGVWFALGLFLFSLTVICSRQIAQHRRARIRVHFE